MLQDYFLNLRAQIFNVMIHYENNNDVSSNTYRDIDNDDNINTEHCFFTTHESFP